MNILMFMSYNYSFMCINSHLSSLDVYNFSSSCSVCFWFYIGLGETFKLEVSFSTALEFSTSRIMSLLSKLILNDLFLLAGKIGLKEQNMKCKGRMCFKMMVDKTLFKWKYIKNIICWPVESHNIILYARNYLYISVEIHYSWRCHDCIHGIDQHCHNGADIDSSPKKKFHILGISVECVELLECCEYFIDIVNIFYTVYYAWITVFVARTC